MTELVHFSVSGGVATLTLDSPPNRNALSAALMEQLSSGLAAAVAEDAVRVIVLTHTGRVFCSGADLKGTAAAQQAGDMPIASVPHLLTALAQSPKPVIARIGGPARAGGIGLIAACDIALAARSATFAFTEVRLGVVPAVISIPVLPLLQPQAARELFLTGEVFDATRAAEIGLLTRVVEDADLDAEVARYAEMLALGAPGALAAAKDLLAHPSTDYAAMSALSADRFAGPEGREGVAAFTQKRRPSWAPPAP
ncbi:MAG TPA: enoyl-CoA hydratase-related protein [Mycobacteriales bacterium]|nr:enoyl-CoA hydratase-related protein [Mycobacteriales bacterium]